MLRKSQIILPYAHWLRKRLLTDSQRAVTDQEFTLLSLIHYGRKTKFGKDHYFSTIRDYKTFKTQVPIREYEGIRPYIDQALQGSSDILWPGRPKYWAKTSGTTSGIKYIPITRDSLPNHINTARNALMNYASVKRSAEVFDGKMIFLSGSPILSDSSGIATGRLSGIVNHEIPFYVKKNQLPSWETNCIEDWDEKVNRIVKETQQADLRLISGIPPWVIMYFERCLENSKFNTITELFPNLSLFVFGGVNYEPYRQKIESLLGKSIDSLETYPASEGFIAYQDQLSNEGLLLNTNSGIFYEFVDPAQIFDQNPDRLTLQDVQLGQSYALILTNNAGLWAYSIGDTVEFVSLDPYRIVVTGRIGHYISAFGEHVIAKEVETAIAVASKKHEAEVVEFTVAPEIVPQSGLPYHEWFVEFAKKPRDIEQFRQDIDLEMQNQNIYYKDLIDGQILQPLKLNMLQRNTFSRYMESIGKLGGQNKVPRLSNDRGIVDLL